MFVSLVVLILVDQITKVYFVSRDFFVPNYGLPFGLNFGVVINSLVIVVALIFFVWYYLNQQKTKPKSLDLGFMFVFAGAISNLGDRLVLGYVRDFVDLGLGFTFNLADIFIVIGLIFILVQTKENGL